MNVRRIEWFLVALAAAGIFAGLRAGAAPGQWASAQAPVPTETATAYPVPDLAGQWSVTRSWYRRCPGCSASIVRTTDWVVTQTGADVRVDVGLSGGLVGTSTGGAYLSLEGLESAPEGPMRFAYATLFVQPDGSAFEGEFGGSERLANPCGPEPPLVTCFASAGYLRAQRVSAPGTPPLPTPGGTAPATATAPTSAPTWIASATATATPPAPTATATPSATARPLLSVFLPACRG